MIKKVVTISPEADIKDAIKLMEKYSIRHLPVVADGQFLGLVTEGILRQLIIPAMIEEIKIKDVMIREPITIEPETDIETAASIIYTYKIGSLPVIKDGKLVGIITTTDILRAFLEIMGILKAGSRLDVVIGDNPADFERIYAIISRHGGRVISVGILPNEKETIYSFRLEKCALEPIIEDLKHQGFQVTANFP